MSRADNEASYFPAPFRLVIINRNSEVSIYSSTLDEHLIYRMNSLARNEHDREKISFDGRISHELSQYCVRVLGFGRPSSGHSRRLKGRGEI